MTVLELMCHFQTEPDIIEISNRDNLVVADVVVVRKDDTLCVSSLNEFVKAYRDVEIIDWYFYEQYEESFSEVCSTLKILGDFEGNFFCKM